MHANTKDCPDGSYLQRTSIMEHAEPYQLLTHTLQIHLLHDAKMVKAAILHAFDAPLQMPSFKQKKALFSRMYWTLELAGFMEDAPWPATKEDLIDYAIRSGAPVLILENLQELEEEEIYENMEEIWPEFPIKEDFMFNEEEY